MCMKCKSPFVDYVDEDDYTWCSDCLNEQLTSFWDDLTTESKLELGKKIWEDTWVDDKVDYIQQIVYCKIRRV